MERRIVSGRTSTWTIDPEYSSVQFTGRLLFTRDVHGSLKIQRGTISVDHNDVSMSSAEAIIGVASITTGRAKRDDHLRSPAFLDAERFPQIHFKTTSVRRGDRDTFIVTGLLTVRGKSHPVTLDVTEMDKSTSPRGEQLAYYSARATLDRLDLGVRRYRAIIGRKLHLRIHVQALKESRENFAHAEPAT